MGQCRSTGWLECGSSDHPWRAVQLFRTGNRDGHDAASGVSLGVASNRGADGRVPVVLAELHALLLAMQASGTILPKSIAGKAISYTLNRWEKLTRFMEHPVIELSTNWAENSMRPIAIGRRYVHFGIMYS